MNRTAPLHGQDTLVVCWDALARLSPGAQVVRSQLGVAAVFPRWAPLNNAIVNSRHHLVEAVSWLTGIYRHAGVDAWALWLPARTSELDAPDSIASVGGLTRDTTTLVMRTVLPTGLQRHGAVVATSIATATRAGEDPIPVSDLEPPDGIPGLSAWVLVHDGVAVSGAWSFQHGRDCGIYAVETLPRWRRHGFARALVEHVLASAAAHGARTASLQSTRMGQPLYESLGFSPVGRYEEWAFTARRHQEVLAEPVGTGPPDASRG